MTAYYNEIDAYAAAWLRNLINAGHLPAGEVDTRSIVDVRPDDLAGFSECHFFAGIGGWPLALRLAGWPADREVWTGSCPCQPFSVAGKGLGTTDERHLWPVFFNLIRSRRPAVVMGEQVAAAVGRSWLDGVCADLEGIGYACGAAIVPACAVDAPHRRDRLWFVADADKSSPGSGREQRGGQFGRSGRDSQARDSDTLADADSGRWGEDGRHRARYPEAHSGRPSSWAGNASQAWADAGWLVGADGKARRVEPSIRLLAYGVPARVGQLRAYGNAIVPPLAAEVIGAYLECRP